MHSMCRLMNIAQIPVNPTNSMAINEIDIERCYDWLNSNAADKKEKVSITKDLCLPKALDGGWGWAVVFGAFTISLICDGISYCFGVLYSELLTHYNESKSKTSFVGSVFFGVSMTLGPLSSVLTSRYGSRTMTVVGGLVSSLGMFLSIFAPSINVLFVTFGFIVGAGFSFCFIASVAIVSFYFEKKISLATGIAVCGTGFGTVTFAPFMDFLIEEYNLSGMFLILSGVCLNLVVCGMLFRPLQFTKKERINELLNRFDKIPYDRGDIEVPENTFGVSSVDAKRDDTMSLVCVPSFVPEHMKIYSSVVLMKALQKARNQDVTLHRYMINAVLQVNHIKDLAFVGTSVDRINSTHTVSNKIDVDEESDRRNLKLQKVQCKVLRPNANTSHEAIRELINNAESKRVTKQTLILTQLPLYKRDIFFRRMDLCNCTFGTSCPELTFNEKSKDKKVFTCRFTERLRILKFNNFCSMFMIMFLLSNFMFYFWIDVPYMYAPDYAVGVGIERSDAVYIISLMGLAITVGQIVFGLIGDLRVDVLLIFATATAMAGFLVCLIPMTDSVVTMVMCFIPLGFCMSVNSSLTCVLLVRYVGLVKLTQAYGILMMTQGVANFVGPMVAGWISDVTGNYDFTFYICGCFFILSGTALYLVEIQRCFSSYRNTKI